MKNFLYWILSFTSSTQALPTMEKSCILACRDLNSTQTEECINNCIDAETSYSAYLFMYMLLFISMAALYCLYAGSVSHARYPTAWAYRSVSTQDLQK